MNIEEAKFILQSYRPGDEDHDDPVFVDALAMLKQSDELRAWHRSEVAFDQLFQSKVQSIEPPADLRVTILAGMRAGATHRAETAALNKVDTTQRSFWAANKWLGLAAAMVVILAVGSLMRWAPQPGTASNRVAAAHTPALLSYLTDHYTAFSGFDKNSNDAATLVSYLDTQGAPHPKMTDLPKYLNGAPTMGCLQTSFYGESISMICFYTEKGMVHLYTADPVALDAEMRTQMPFYHSDRNRNYRVWEDEGRLFMLANEGKKEVLRDVF